MSRSTANRSSAESSVVRTSPSGKDPWMAYAIDVVDDALRKLLREVRDEWRKFGDGGTAVFLDRVRTGHALFAGCPDSKSLHAGLKQIADLLGDSLPTNTPVMAVWMLVHPSVFAIKPGDEAWADDYESWTKPFKKAFVAAQNKKKHAEQREVSRRESLDGAFVAGARRAEQVLTSLGVPQKKWLTGSQLTSGPAYPEELWESTVAAMVHHLVERQAA